jgi:hypothetical protein
MAKVGDIVTITQKTVGVSNTFIVDADLGNGVILVRHPLAKECFLKVSENDLNKVSPNIKDSIERSLDFARINQKFLDKDSSEDLDSLCLTFIVRKSLTPRQKQILSNINGYLAKQIIGSIKETMSLIKSNQGVLDEFNTMWFNNFRGIFSGQQQISSAKQETSIYNMAGFVLAELNNPITIL